MYCKFCLLKNHRVCDPTLNVHFKFCLVKNHRI